jgi:DtxR family Mn-dependent transcriptional regulator
MSLPLKELINIGAQQLRDAGVMPGAKGDYRFNEGYVLIQMEGKDEGLELPVELASHIFLVGEPA